MRSVCAVALSTTEAPRYGSASRTAQQSDERFAPMQSKRCLPFDSGCVATDAVTVRSALRTTEAPSYGSGGRGSYQAQPRVLCAGAKRDRWTVGGYGWRSRTSELRWYAWHSAH